MEHRELVTAEEGKLDVSRSLLDLKLEHSKLLERFESDRYALTTDLLAAKNEVVELEMRQARKLGHELHTDVFDLYDGVQLFGVMTDRLTVVSKR